MVEFIFIHEIYREEVEECIGGSIEYWDQYQYLGNCPPTPPLTQQQSIDNKSG